MPDVGRIDVLVNNAGDIQGNGLLEDVKYKIPFDGVILQQLTDRFVS